MTTDVVLPVFNEERRLARHLPRLHAFLNGQSNLHWRILIANNGSSDRTQEIANDLSRNYERVEVVYLPERGRGGAIKQCWLSSHSDVLCYMDVDLATDLDAFPPLVQAVVSGRADLAIGSRRLPESKTQRSLHREIISRLYVRLIRILCAVGVSDAQCGFKAISRPAAQELLPRVRDTGWFFDTELVVRAKLGGFRVKELPVTWKEDSDSRVKIFPTAWRNFRGLCRLRAELREHGKTLPTSTVPASTIQSSPSAKAI